MTQSIALQVTGMHCASCVGRAEKALVATPGVVSANVNLANGTAHVAVDGAHGATLAEVLTAAGYPAQVRYDPSERTDHRQAADALWRRFWIAFALTLPVFLVEMGGHLIPALHHWVAMNVGMQVSWVAQFVLITLVLAWPGRIFFDIGLKALMRGTPEMNSLVALGAGAAWVFSTFVTFVPTLIPVASRAVYFEAAGVIVTLILLGRALEARAKGRAGAAIEALIDLQPGEAPVLEDGVPVDRPIAQIRSGDVVLARPGARIAVDGEITEGIGLVDESMLTGEPVPVSKAPGDKVTAGTLNGTATLTYRVTAVGADTVLARITHMVDQAQGTKLPVQARVDRITAVFVPVVMGLALLSVVGWLVFGGTLAQAMVAGVSVLIIACPCAMGLAVPVSIVVATGRAAQLGVLFRGGDALERLADVRSFGFDKTGTLTKGTPTVVRTEWIEDREQIGDFLSLQTHSEHPLAQAIARSEPCTPRDVEDVRATVGRGVQGRVGESDLAIGSAAFMAELGLDTGPLKEAEAACLREGQTPVFAARDGVVVGLWGLTDPIKEDAAEALAVLQAQGAELTLVSGDRKDVAQSVARKLGISDVVSEVMPADKLSVVADMQTQGPVAFVGDGINDAPALAQADVGVAMGRGTDVAIEAADVVLMSEHLMGVARAATLSRATLRNIRQNLFWAFAYNVALIPLAMGLFYPLFGWQLSPMLGAGAMALSSVFVVTNALRLRAFG